MTQVLSTTSPCPDCGGPRYAASRYEEENPFNPKQGSVKWYAICVRCQHDENRRLQKQVATLERENEALRHCLKLAKAADEELI